MYKAKIYACAFSIKTQAGIVSFFVLRYLFASRYRVVLGLTLFVLLIKDSQLL